MNNTRQTVSIAELMDGVVSELQRLRYSDSSIRHKREVWKRYLKYTQYSVFVYDDWLKFLKDVYSIDALDGKLNRNQRNAREAFKSLYEFYKDGSLHSWTLVRNNPETIPPEYREVVEHFAAHLIKLGRAEPTRCDYYRTLRRLSHFLIKEKIYSIGDISPEIISPFIASVATYHGKSIGTLTSKLRQFFRFLYLNGYHAQDLSLFIPKSNILRLNEHLPQFWTSEDIKKILSCVDRANPTGKRDYAIILLIARSGLRISDVKRLKFSNIKWDKNCIELVQHKTKQPLVLPLYEDVGSAIIDYIQNGRPESDAPNIFIRHQAPYIEFSEYNRLHATITHYIYKAGLEIGPDKSHGMHSLRHSLAADMLKKDVPLPVIQEVLGHKNIETTINYLRIDIEQLRKCTLSLEVPNAY